MQLPSTFSFTSISINMNLTSYIWLVLLHNHVIDKRSLHQVLQGHVHVHLIHVQLSTTKRLTQNEKGVYWWVKNYYAGYLNKWVINWGGHQLRKYSSLRNFVYSFTVIPHCIYSTTDWSKHAQYKGLVQPCVRCSDWIISSASDCSSRWRIITHSNLLKASCPSSNIFLSTASRRNWAFSVGSFDIYNGFDISHHKRKHTYNSALLLDTLLSSICCQRH